MPCTHLENLKRLQPPTTQLVHREECTLCFDNQDSPLGIDVCLTCFNAGCLDPERRHGVLHYQKTHHPFTLNIKRKLKPRTPRAEDEEPPAKMKKLAITEEREEDKYERILTVKCWDCAPTGGEAIPSALEIPEVARLVNGVMSSLSSARQSEVKAWEEEIVPCEHTLTLSQDSSGPIPASGLAHCRSCDLKENLWLCMTCGSLGCGRQLHGGLGGNGHGLEHYKSTRHPVAVKLGTITPEGNADIYCYDCDDSKQDPELVSHLSAFGINIRNMSKTEKSTTELQIEHNLSYEFSLKKDDGTALEPVFGFGLTGLQNLGNSCYMASVLQTIFSLRPFQDRYSAGNAFLHIQRCDQLPATCLECQMYKVADGLLSGRYSHPANYEASPSPGAGASQHPSPTPVFQEGIRPVMFKTIIGKDHIEFSTMRQQDSEEFFTHLLNSLRRDLHRLKQRYGETVGDDVTINFSYGWEQRLQCTDCKKVRYQVEEADVVSVSIPATEKGKTDDGKVLYEEVPLTRCLDALFEVEALEYSCPSCKKKVHALKQTRFASFPAVLVVHAKKFQLVNWVPAKLDIPVVLPPGDILQFEAKHLGTGLQSDEVELQDTPPALPQFDIEAMTHLQAMGFSELRCQKALLATGGGGADFALSWLLDHAEDPDIDEPLQRGSTQAAAPEPPAELVNMLADMGFTNAQARKALRETNNNMERAVEWLFSHPDDDGSPETSNVGGSKSATIHGTKDVPVTYRLKAFISHKGPSVHSGHYVVHIRKGAEWILFNDEKVVRADEESVKELKKLAYMYIFERV